MKAISW
jgi:hypothetical protein